MYSFWEMKKEEKEGRGGGGRRCREGEGRGRKELIIGSLHKLVILTEQSRNLKRDLWGQRETVLSHIKVRQMFWVWCYRMKSTRKQLAQPHSAPCVPNRKSTGTVFSFSFSCFSLQLYLRVFVCPWCEGEMLISTPAFPSLLEKRCRPGLPCKATAAERGVKFYSKGWLSDVFWDMLLKT